MKHCWHGYDDPNCKEPGNFKKVTLRCCRCKKYSGIARWWESCRGLQAE